MSTIYQLLLGWLPSDIAAVILGLFALLIILLILKIVIWILDSLPFI